MRLSIETSAVTASAAVTDGLDLIAISYQRRGLTHSRTLMPMIRDMLKNCELDISAIDSVAVSSGPGSFTGLRIGLATAKGLAWSLGLACCPVSTLEALAHNVSFMDGIICAVMDARAGQVYNALFEAEDGVLTRLTKDRALSVAELASEVESGEKRYILVGDGARLCYNSFCRQPNIVMAPEHLVYQSAVGIARAAYFSGVVVSANELRASYLRLPQAERERRLHEKRD